MIVNLAGCFAIGLISEFLAQRTQLPHTWRLFLMTGFLASFTTFSTFAMDIGFLVHRYEIFKATVYVSVSVS